MFLNKISRVFILILLIISVSDAGKTRKESKSVEKKHSEHSEKDLRAAWPTQVDCEKTNTFDTTYDPTSKEAELVLDSDCGKTLLSMKKSETKSRGKSGSFHKYLFELQQSVEVLKLLGQKGKASGERIVNGSPVRGGEFPWLAAIGDIGGRQFCGGSIINTSWILTAAHCFENGFDPMAMRKTCRFNVRVGVSNWKEDPEGKGEDRLVIGVYRHPGYNVFSKEHDIALLKLDRPIEAQGRPINTVCIPKTGRSAKKGQMCIVSGWGDRADGNGLSGPDTALKTSLPLIGYDGDKCGEYLNHQVRPGMLCAGYTDGSTDTCQGDSGGPLVTMQDGRYYQLGVVSFGQGCATKGYPGIYTDVGQYRHFIASVMRRHS